MGRMKNCQYYVEGECEEKFINVLKSSMGLLIPGKVEVLNVITEKISDSHLRVLKPNTIVVLVFDTDVESKDILMNNIRKIENSSHVSKTILIPQSMNFEDELLRCTSIHTLKEFTGSRSERDFKHDFLHMTNLQQKLIAYKFELTKLWNQKPSGIFHDIQNESELIKEKKHR